MYRLTYFTGHPPAEFNLPPGVDEHGSYNVPPSPVREATLDEYIHHSKSHAPIWLEYRQLKHLAPDLPWVTVWIEWHWNAGWIIVQPNKWHSRNEEKEGPGYRLVYDDPVRYFRVGCDHEYETVARPNRWTEIRRCKHCPCELRVED